MSVERRDDPRRVGIRQDEAVERRRFLGGHVTLGVLDELLERHRLPACFLATGHHGRGGDRHQHAPVAIVLDLNGPSSLSNSDLPLGRRPLRLRVPLLHRVRELGAWRRLLCGLVRRELVAGV